MELTEGTTYLIDVGDVRKWYGVFRGRTADGFLTFDVFNVGRDGEQSRILWTQAFNPTELRSYRGCRFSHAGEGETA